MSNLELSPEVCTFCAELLGFSRNTNYGKLTDDTRESRIIWRNREFALMPSLGPLVEGHLLLIPTHHALSFANLSPEALAKARSLIAEVERFFTSHCPDVVVFEHGAVILTDSDHERRVKRAMCGACTDHAHIHIVPAISARSVISRMEELSIHMQKVELDDLDRLREVVNVQLPYIVVGGSQMDRWMVFLLEYVPTQFMRRTVASIVGLTEWEWREFPRIDLVQAAVRRMGPRLNDWLEGQRGP